MTRGVTREAVAACVRRAEILYLVAPNPNLTVVPERAAEAVSALVDMLVEATSGYVLHDVLLSRTTVRTRTMSVRATVRC
jgi:hypothetical protein